MSGSTCKRVKGKLLIDIKQLWDYVSMGPDFDVEVMNAVKFCWQELIAQPPRLWQEMTGRDTFCLNHSSKQNAGQNTAGHFREYKSSCRPKGIFCKSISSSYYLAQTMRFSFFTVVVALTTSVMSVSACAPREAPCSHDWDCCDKLDLCVSIPDGAQMCYHKGD